MMPMRMRHAMDDARWSAADCGLVRRQVPVATSDGPRSGPATKKPHEHSCRHHAIIDLIDNEAGSKHIARFTHHCENEASSGARIHR